MAAGHRELKASRASCHWPSFDARSAPVLTIRPGDRGTLCVGAGSFPPGRALGTPDHRRRSERFDSSGDACLLTRAGGP